MSHPASRILGIWLPNWPVQRLLVERPELKGRPVVLFAHDPRQRPYAVACSLEARQQAVQPGMPLAEAAALRRKKEEKGKKKAAAPSDAAASENLVLLPHDPAADRAELQALARWCDQFSPIGGWEETTSSEALFLDVTTTAHLYGGESNLALQVVRAFHQRGYQIRVAIAGTVGAAWAMARFYPSSSQQIKSSPHAQSSPHAPREDITNRPPLPPCHPESPVCAEGAVFIVPADQTAQFVGPLPLAALRLPDQTLDQLDALGIQCIDQLAALPRSALAARFGEQILLRLDQVLGRKQEVLLAEPPELRLETEWHFSQATDRRTVIQRAIKHLVHELVRLLVLNNRGVVELECLLVCENGRSLSIRIGLFRPTAHEVHLLQLLDLRLETVRVSAPVSCVRLAATAIARLGTQQPELWSGELGSGPPQLSHLIDRLASRLGSQAVLRSRWQPGALPEQAYAVIPLTGSSGSLTRLRTPRSQPAHAPGQRPLCLYQPPRPLRVASVVPDGPPLSFGEPSMGQGLRHQVARCWGPERIETAWWQGTCIRRDYYRVETKTGQRFWLFRDLESGDWYLHGVFS